MEVDRRVFIYPCWERNDWWLVEDTATNSKLHRWSNWKQCDLLGLCNYLQVLHVQFRCLPASSKVNSLQKVYYK